MRVRRWSLGLSCVVLLGCTPTGEGKQQRSDAESEQPVPEPPPVARTTPPPVADQPGRLPSFVPTRYRLALGHWHTCAIRDGAVYCWGANSKGQLGDRSEVDRPRPVPVIGIDDAVSIVAGSEHSCALRASGRVWCWGNDDEGQVSGEAGGPRPQPVEKAGLEQVKAIAAWGTKTCAIDGHERVQCWGQLVWDGRRLEIETLAAIDLGVGEHSVCALARDGHVDCRGPNYYGELGVLDRELFASRVEGLSDADALSVGDVHACVHRPGDTIACWGSGIARQTGTAFQRGIKYSETNTNVAINEPNLVKLPAIAQVSAGFHHTCVLARDGRVGCFGSNSDGQSRPGDDLDKSAEVYWLPEPTDVVEVAAKTWHSCALRANGEVWCWGDDSRAQLGGGSLREVEQAVGLVQLDPLDAELSTLALDGRTGTACPHDIGERVGERGDELWCVSDGPWMYGDERVAEFVGSCARLESGRVVCEYQEFELGGVKIERLGAGSDSCFVLAGGGLGCYDNHKIERVLDSGVTRVAIGRNVMCIADQAGAPSCWATNHNPEDPPKHMTQIADVLDVEQLAIAWDSACAVTRSGDVKCWSFEGKDAWQAKIMPGMPPAVAIAAMERHVCAVTREGQVWCWGRNFQGELGDGTTGDRDHPVQVKGIPPAVAVDGEDLYTCARTRDEQLWCWGEHPFARADADQLRASVGEARTISKVVGLP